MATIPLADIIAKADKAFKPFTGDMGEFESAVGALVIGRHLGWRVLLLVHDRRTIAKYEKILGIDFREALEEVGPWAHKSIAWNVVNKAKSLYWKVVRGEHPLEKKGHALRA